MKTLVRAGAATSAFVTAVAMAAGVPDVSVAAASSATSPTGTATYGRSVREALRQPASEPVRLQPSDPRIRTVVYSPDAVVFIPVRRGVVTQIVLTEDDAITLQPAMGKGADCARETDTWCVIASGRDIFIKPKTGATTNNMVLVASRRRYVFDFKVISEGPASQAVMRVSMVVPLPAAPLPVVVQAAAAVDRGPPPLTPKELIANRMKSVATVRNKDYSVAVGDYSDDIVPAMVFDDGTKTYFSFPNNRPLPTIFESLADQSEEMVNAHMEGDQLVADRVARRFLLRLGNSVAAIINESFDIDGVAPVQGTTVPGVRRVVRPADITSAAARGEAR